MTERNEMGKTAAEWDAAMREPYPYRMTPTSPAPADVVRLAARLKRFRERIASATAATNMSVDSQATAIAMITTMHAALFEEIALYLTGGDHE